jgi:predicted GIY-YIG superfamily endonuclease
MGKKQKKGKSNAEPGSGVVWAVPLFLLGGWLGTYELPQQFVGPAWLAWSAIWAGIWLWFKFFSGFNNEGKNPGIVYVIRDLDTGLYKIGRTKNMERRMKELGVGRTAELISRNDVGDMVAVEKAAHERYKKDRLPQSEYFKLKNPPVI